MTGSNLAIVFGPTLLGPPPSASTADGSNGPSGMALQDMSFQCKAVETILDKYSVSVLIDHGRDFC